MERKKCYLVKKLMLLELQVSSVPRSRRGRPVARGERRGLLSLVAPLIQPEPVMIILRSNAKETNQRRKRNPMDHGGEWRKGKEEAKIKVFSSAVLVE